MKITKEVLSCAAGEAPQQAEALGDPTLKSRHA